MEQEFQTGFSKLICDACLAMLKGYELFFCVLSYLSECQHSRVETVAFVSFCLCGTIVTTAASGKDPWPWELFGVRDIFTVMLYNGTSLSRPP